MSKSRVGSLGRRLSSWLALQSFAGLALVCGVVYALAALSFQARQVETLEQKEAQVRHLVAEATTGGDIAALQHKLSDFLLGHQGLSLRLRRNDGGVIFESVPPVGRADDAGVREVQFELPALPAVAPKIQATLMLDLSDEEQLLRRLAFTLLAAALIGMAVVSIGGYVLVGFALRPLRDLVDQTRRLAADTLYQRLDGSAQPEELEPLIEQFNALLARLALAYEQLEAFNADVAHELCTPLATVIGSTELALRRQRSADALRDVLGSNLEDLRRMAAIVQDMLFLSQADRGVPARREPVASLAIVVKQVLEYHEASLMEADLITEIDGDAKGDFDIALLQRALSNLLSNTTRYADRGSTVTIQIVKSKEVVQLTVANKGRDISPEHLPRLFDRFYRVDAARNDAARNHGLGLAIVAGIARMHGGKPLARSEGGTTTIGLCASSGNVRTVAQTNESRKMTTELVV